MSNTTTAPRLDLIAQLLAAGFQLGAPPHVSQESQDIDAGVARRCRCSHCGRYGARFQSLRRGHRYVGVAECPHCGNQTEV